jgi:hypothetical protein
VHSENGWADFDKQCQMMHFDASLQGYAFLGSQHIHFPNGDAITQNPIWVRQKWLSSSRGKPLEKWCSQFVSFLAHSCSWANKIWCSLGNYNRFALQEANFF